MGRPAQTSGGLALHLRVWVMCPSCSRINVGQSFRRARRNQQQRATSSRAVPVSAGPGRHLAPAGEAAAADIPPGYRIFKGHTLNAILTESGDRVHVAFRVLDKVGHHNHPWSPRGVKIDATQAWRALPCPGRMSCWTKNCRPRSSCPPQYCIQYPVLLNFSSSAYSMQGPAR